MNQLKMFLSKAHLWFLVCALLCSQFALSAHIPRGSLAEHEAVSKSLRRHEPRDFSLTHTPITLPAPAAARSIGIHIHPLTAPILPQAIGQILIQTLFTAFVEFGSRPEALSSSFRHSVSSRVPNFNVEFEMTAKGNQSGVTAKGKNPGDFLLTNSRIVETLSLLGFDYSNQQNVSSLVEYDFDVVVDVWKQPEIVIASGSVKNIVPGTPVIPNSS